MAAWLVHGSRLRAGPPAGWKLLRLGAWALAGAVFAAYDQGGTLAYHEFAAGLVLHRGLALGVTVPWIWVDDDRALQGGQDHWAIPKQLAAFEIGEEPASVRVLQEGLEAAAVRSSPRRVPPAPVASGFTIVQPEADGLALARARIAGRLRLSHSRWRGRGALAFLSGRPVFSAELSGLRLEVGPARRSATNPRVHR